ncbi:hypothetical protein QVD17_10072 [Tagetes erecta]|uniref:Uncharacterized protein n=1 Tax=Tagetes erecta TaxID=13708 RepID=A0AAD8L5J8_TARER|nr:hypothetical protein QVD17_10072 [Tagetes erecta]
MIPTTKQNKTNREVPIATPPSTPDECLRLFQPSINFISHSQHKSFIHSFFSDRSKIQCLGFFPLSTDPLKGCGVGNLF